MPDQLDPNVATAVAAPVTAAVTAGPAPIAPALDKPGTNASASGQQAAPERVFSQDDVNRIVAERLSRERAQYGDYDQLKAAAAKWAKHEEELKTEAERTKELLTKLQTERDAAIATANERLIRAAFIAEASKAGALHPEDVYALADLSNVKVDERGAVSGVTEAVKAIVDAGRIPLSSGPAKPNATKLDGGAGSANRTAEKEPPLSDEELATAKRLGISPEKYAARRNDIKKTAPRS